MKRNVCLIAGLIGLLLIEYGCKEKPQGYPTTYLVVSETESATIFHINEWGQIDDEAKDSVISDSFEIAVLFKTAYVQNETVNENKSSTSVYADPILPGRLHFQLDSMKIYNVATTDSLEITDLFNLSIGFQNNDSIAISNDEEFNDVTGRDANQYFVHRLFLRDSLLVGEKMRFQIKYYPSNRAEMEITTKAVFVKP